MYHECVSLCVREAKQSAQRKHSSGSPLVSVVEREETECREGLEPDATEHTTNSPDSTTDKIEVHRITVCWGTNLIYIYRMCLFNILQSIPLNIEPQLIVVITSHLFK